MERTHFWTSHNFLEKIIRDFKHDANVSVCNSSVQKASAEGDNYISKLFRVIVKLEDPDEETAIFVKVPPDEGIVRDMIMDTSTFSTEMRMYGETLPEMDKLLARITSKKIPKLWPKCYYISRAEEPLVLIIEDLAKKGYMMAIRQKGLDLEHCLVAMKTLARFHACSFAVHEENPSSIESYTTNFFFEDSGQAFWETCFKSTLTTVAEVVRKWDNFGDRVAEKLHAKAGTMRDDVVNLMMESKEGEFKVLVHGDLWTNNLLFRYNEGTGELEDAMLIDFQFCFFASPAIDLQHFLASSPTEDVRINHKDELLRAYHAEICDMLHLLGQGDKVVTFHQLLEEYERMSLYGAFVTLLCLPVILSDPSDCFDFERALRDEVDKEVTARRTQNEDYAKVLRRLLPLFESKGII